VEALGLVAKVWFPLEGCLYMFLSPIFTTFSGASHGGILEEGVKCRVVANTGIGLHASTKNRFVLYFVLGLEFGVHSGCWYWHVALWAVGGPIGGCTVGGCCVFWMLVVCSDCF